MTFSETVFHFNNIPRKYVKCSFKNEITSDISDTTNNFKDIVVSRRPRRSRRAKCGTECELDLLDGDGAEIESEMIRVCFDRDEFEQRLKASTDSILDCVLLIVDLELTMMNLN